MTNFCLQMASVVLEALPFLLLGSLISGFLEVFLPSDWLSRTFAGESWRAGFWGLLLGLVIPTCECGSVPIMRRLLAKGAPPHLAFAYLLAGTVVNPLVLYSTWMAFPHKPWMVALRAGMSLVVAALTTTVIVHRVPRGKELAPRTRLELHPLHCSCHGGASWTGGNRLWRILDSARYDFTAMFRLLVLGATLAAVVKTGLPDQAWIFLQDHPLLAVPGMMVLSFLLSLCSEADAFVAAALNGVPSAAQLAFLAIGPVLDIKLLLMYRRTFAPQTLRILLVMPPFLILVFSLLLSRCLS
ncbi:MAG TPA: permease [Fibrobacteraceae bacterium]|nr:permease [Fibrobacteraceae bacterium]